MRETATDNNRVVRNLTSSGFTERQAEVLAKEAELMRLSIKTDIAVAKAELLKWIAVVAMVVQAVGIAVFVKL